jgi:hypothetical protein
MADLVHLGHGVVDILFRDSLAGIEEIDESLNLIAVERT